MKTNYEQLKELFDAKLDPMKESLGRIETRLDEHINGEVKEIKQTLEIHCNADKAEIKEAVKTTKETKRNNLATVFSTIAIIIALLGIYVQMKSNSCNASTNPTAIVSKQTK